MISSNSACSAPRPAPLSRILGSVLCVLLGTATALRAAEAPLMAFDLDDLSLEQLVNVEITSVAKKETSLFRSPAAIGVVTSDDMRRMGATSFPEAMRWLPGVQIAQIDHNIWSVGARGFGFQFTDKLLVLQDGRSIYTPLFAGVHWDAHDAVLEDIERIEVIRGPGATLWGANAVNGVINIISKSARDTQGGLLSVAGGPGEGAEVSLRYGGEAARDVHYRAYVKHFDRDPMRDSFGAELPEDWQSWRGGFRLDWERASGDLLTVQGDVMTATVEEMYREPSFTPPYFTLTPIESESHAFNLLGRWTRVLANDSELTVQSYVESGVHESFGTREERDTFDLDVQHRIVFGERHDLIWGAGFRVSRDDVAPSSNATWVPQRQTLRLATAFVQDEIVVVPERVHLVVGSKIEHNDFTGVEVQPGVRLLWMPDAHQTVWAAVSRAVRTPSRQNDGLQAYLGVMDVPEMGGLFASFLRGHEDLSAEVLHAYELGYRAEIGRWLSVDVAGFQHDYRDYITFLPSEPEFVFEPVPHLRHNFDFANGASFSSHGGEITATAIVTPSLRLVADHTQQFTRLPDQGLGEVAFVSRQTSVRAFWRVRPGLELMAAVGYVGELPSPYPGFPEIPSYTRVDLGVIWRPTDALEIGVWGRNLQESRHLETYGVTTPQPAEIPRSVLGRVTWRF
jgi:iron complex outermembrane receptor protein